MKYVILLEVYRPTKDLLELHVYDFNGELKDAVNLSMSFIKKISILNYIMVLSEDEFKGLSLGGQYPSSFSATIGNSLYNFAHFLHKEITVKDVIPFFFSYGKHYFSMTEMTYLVMEKIPHTNSIQFFISKKEMNKYFEDEIISLIKKVEKGEIMMSEIHNSYIIPTFGEIERGITNFLTLDEVKKYKDICDRYGDTKYFKFSNE